MAYSLGKDFNNLSYTSSKTFQSAYVTIPVGLSPYLFWNASTIAFVLSLKTEFVCKAGISGSKKAMAFK